MSPAELRKRSPLESGSGLVPLSKFFVADGAVVGGLKTTTPEQSIAALNAEGYWPGSLGYNSHPYTRDGSMTVTPGDFSQAHVGDETDTSPYRDEKLIGISTAEYVRNMGILIRALQGGR